MFKSMLMIFYYKSNRYIIKIPETIEDTKKKINIACGLAVP